MSRPDSIKAVIFDFGGVLMRTDDQSFRRAWESHFGLAPGELLRIVSENEASLNATLGKGSEQQVWTYIQEKFHLTSQALDDLVRDFWAGDRLDNRLLGYLSSLRPRLKTALLSNAWTGAREVFTGFRLDRVFDMMIISSEVGIAKPDPEIYRQAVSRLEITPSEAVFVDDVAENVEAAAALGLQGIRFHSTEQVLTDLKRKLG